MDMQQEKNKYAADNTSVCTFMYYPLTKTINVPERTRRKYHCRSAYTDMPHSFAQEVVCAEDTAAFEAAYFRIAQGEKTAIAEFRSKDMKTQTSISLTAVSWDREGRTSAVLGIAADVPGSLFFASYYVDLKTGTFQTVHATDYARKMLEGCVKMEDGFRNFIQTLVREEYTEKMRVFCSAETIAERLRDHRRMDCEYESRIACSRCMASFIPLDHDSDGEVHHVLFAISMVNRAENTSGRKNSDKKSLEALMNQGPGELILYKWDSERLKTLSFSEYCTGRFKGNSSGETEADFMEVHPEDRIDCQEAVITCLQKTCYLDHIYRVWNRAAGRYIRVRVNAVSEPQADGSAYVYAMYKEEPDPEAEESLTDVHFTEGNFYDIAWANQEALEQIRV